MKLFDTLNRKLSDFLTGTPSTPAATNPDTPVADNGGPVAPTAGAWPLSRILMHFKALHPTNTKLTVQEPFSLRAAYEGIFVMGMPGSGKSSASGRHLAAALLRAGAGGLVMCAKPEEVETWQGYAQESGRGEDLIVFGEQGDCGFNFLDYEMAAGKGNPAEAATNILMEIVEAVSGSRKGGGDTQIWVDYAKELIQNALNACLLAGESVSVAGIFKLATSDAAVDAVLAKAQARAEAGELTPSQVADLEAVKEYLLQQWRTMDERPKSSVLMTASAAGRTFRQGTMRDLFTGKTTITPDAILEGKIIVVDLSVMRYQEAGRAANVLWKYCLQRAIQRRGKVKDTDQPTFIFADEAHYFVTKRDAEFVTTSRSAGCCNIYLTQNLPNLLSRLDEHATYGFLGCFGTKVFHANADTKTNEWAADSIAKMLHTRTSISTSYNVTNAGAGPGGGGGTSQQQVIDHELPPRKFLELATGGEHSNYIVTAYLFRSGYVFPTTGKIYLLVGFNQRELFI